MINVVKNVEVDIDKSNGIYFKKYDKFTKFVLGYCEVTKDKKTSYIDIYGNSVILSESKINLIKQTKNNKHNSNLHVNINNKKYGYKDNNDKIIIEHKYDCAREFNDGLACVVLERKYGFIDEFDNFVINPKYDYACNFEDGIAIIRNNKWGIIDKNEKEVFPCIASEIMYLGYNRVYIDGYMYDLANVKLKYNLIIEMNNTKVKRSFSNKSELEEYEKRLYNVIYDIVEKNDNAKIKKLTI